MSRQLGDPGLTALVEADDAQACLLQRFAKLRVQLPVTRELLVDVGVSVDVVYLRGRLYGQANAARQRRSARRAIRDWTSNAHDHRGPARDAVVAVLAVGDFG